MVTGVDGLAGGGYMRQGENSCTGSIKNLRTLPEILRRAFADDALAKKCVEGGLKTSVEYGYAPFARAWLAQISAMLGRQPHGA
jgi:hypothetical protein